MYVVMSLCDINTNDHIDMNPVSVNDTKLRNKA